ncbi:MAG: reverse transcriptase/maturase family protein [Gammaproteobacteria bacterium]
MPSSKTLYQQVRSANTLRKSWAKVNRNALSSPNSKAREEARLFGTSIDRHLSRIARQLRYEKFKFGESYGALGKKSSGKNRPIVVAPLENRIVQRAILETLHSIPSLSSIINIPTSCGGIPKRSVRYGLECAHKKITADGEYFYKSDIRDFFTKISKSAVIDALAFHIEDEKFLRLIEDSLETILVNEKAIGEEIRLFPTGDLGVAQGSCLSPFLGNLLLWEFDRATNSEDVMCLRYIDDFLILGPSKSAVKTKLRAGKKILTKLGMEIYDHSTHPDKASLGLSSDGFEFLGCNVDKNMIFPVRNRVRHLIASIRKLVDFSLIAMNSTKHDRPLNKRSYVETLDTIHNTARAWGNHYQFCNNKLLFTHVDKNISDEINRLTAGYLDALADIDYDDFEQRRRILGVHLLADSKYDPIVKTES